MVEEKVYVDMKEAKTSGRVHMEHDQNVPGLVWRGEQGEGEKGNRSSDLEDKRPKW